MAIRKVFSLFCVIISHEDGFLSAEESEPSLGAMNLKRRVYGLFVKGSWNFDTIGSFWFALSV